MRDLPLKPAQHRTVVGDIVEQMKDLILEGTFRPGERLPSEKDLAVRFGVSRPALREALRTLNGLGLVTQTREGAVVSTRDERFFAEPLSWLLLLNRVTVRELFEARKVLEVQIVGLAAHRATERDLQRIADEQERLRRSRTPEEFTESNFAFHLAIAKACHNRVLYHMLQAIRHLLSRAEAVGGAWPAVVAASITSHDALLDAIRRRDAVGAQEEMLIHLREVQDQMLLHDQESLDRELEGKPGAAEPGEPEAHH